MKKNLGLLLLLIAACVFTYAINDRFLAPVNIENLLRRTALFSLISIGASFVIASAGIDLSIGSMVCLVGTLFPWLSSTHGWPWLPAIASLLSLAALLGAFHGVLITKLKLQPFIVTLCGLLLYRGIARGVTGDQTQGFGIEFEGLRSVALAKLSFGGLSPIAIPGVVFITLAISLLAAFVLNRTRYGLYLRAIGRNEVAARYSGIDTDSTKVIAYVVCSLLAGLSGVLFILDVNSAQPSDFGNFYELYAIAAAVLGGCSLRGGEASVSGVIIGSALMQVLRNAIVLLDIPTQLEFAIIGGVILLGVAAEELVRRFPRRSAASTRG
jgi:ribose transport system permease protein